MKARLSWKQEAFRGSSRQNWSFHRFSKLHNTRLIELVRSKIFTYLRLISRLHPQRTNLFTYPRVHTKSRWVNRIYPNYARKRPSNLSKRLEIKKLARSNLLLTVWNPTEEYPSGSAVPSFRWRSMFLIQLAKLCQYWEWCNAICAPSNPCSVAQRPGKENSCNRRNRRREDREEDGPDVGRWRRCLRGLVFRLFNCAWSCSFVSHFHFRLQGNFNTPLRCVTDKQT